MKPTLRKPRRMWMNDYGKELGKFAFPTHRDAENYAISTGNLVALQVEFVEVIPEPRQKR